MKKDDMLNVFQNYCRLFEQLDREYGRTPGWRMIRQFTLLGRMHKVNKDYERWYSQWLKNSNTQ